MRMTRQTETEVLRILGGSVGSLVGNNAGAAERQQAQKHQQAYSCSLWDV
jgi:hypothetical protein